MTAIKKGTKLTDNPKDYMLRVRLDESTLKELDECCEYNKCSRSEFVRTCIAQEYTRIKK